MKRRLRPVSLAAPLLAILATSPAAHAQWSADVSTNQLVSGASSDQNQPKIVAAADGGYWVSWLDGIGTGWDVRLQRFDRDGQAMLGAQGMLVADRGFSSTQDYGLDVAANGDALLAFRDDRGGTVEITAARITPSGGAVFGGAGVTLSSGGAFVAAPGITGRGGTTYVAWTQNSGVRVRGLDAAGNPTSLDVVLTPTVGSYALADIHAVEADAVLSMVHITGGFSAPKHLVAQRITPTGALPWGAAPVAVFDGGSLQFGSFPDFAIDGSGTSVFSWYSASPTLECFAQKLDASGTELWPHGGVAVSTAPAAVRVNPTAALDPGSGDVLVTWVEQNTLQSQSGISAQRISAAGNRLWSSSGVPVVPVGGSGAGFPKVFSVAPAGEAFLVWSEEPSFGAAQLFGARLDAGGAVSIPRFDVASTASGKMRLTGAAGALEGVLLAWSDTRTDGGDIYAQQLDFDGTPGDSGVISVPTCAGVPNSTGAASETVVAGDPDPASNRVSLHALGVPPQSSGFFLTSRTSGLVVGAGGSSGNLCLGGSIGRFVGPGQVQNSGRSTRYELQLDLTMHPTPTGLVSVMSGEQWYFQAWHRDLGPTGVTSNFSGACAVTFP